MSRIPFVAVAALACNADGKDGGDGGDGVETDYAFECDVTEAYDLPDPFAGIAGREHACEGTLYFDELPAATGYFVGEFHFDDCGNLKGTETWRLYANDLWLENGGADCFFVWNLDG